MTPCGAPNISYRLHIVYHAVGGIDHKGIYAGRQIGDVSVFPHLGRCGHLGEDTKVGVRGQRHIRARGPRLTLAAHIAVCPVQLEAGAVVRIPEAQGDLVGVFRVFRADVEFQLGVLDRQRGKVHREPGHSFIPREPRGGKLDVPILLLRPGLAAVCVDELKIRLKVRPVRIHVSINKADSPLELHIGIVVDGFATYIKVHQPGLIWLRRIAGGKIPSRGRHIQKRQVDGGGEGQAGEVLDGFAVWLGRNGEGIHCFPAVKGEAQLLRVGDEALTVRIFDGRTQQPLSIFWVIGNGQGQLCGGLRQGLPAAVIGDLHFEIRDGKLPGGSHGNSRGCLVKCPRPIGLEINPSVIIEAPIYSRHVAIHSAAVGEKVKTKSP